VRGSVFGGAVKRGFGFVLSHISSHKVRGRRYGVPMVSQIDAVQKAKQILHSAYPNRTDVRSGAQTRSVQDDWAVGGAIFGGER
jgi:hypothetical protein